jgi:hypothetical protein
VSPGGNLFFVIKGMLMKKIMLTLILAGLLSCLPAMSARADIIEMDNGSKIIGTVTKINGTAVTVKTDFAGVIAVDLAHIVSCRTDGELNFYFSDRQKVFGKLTLTKESARVRLPEGGEFVSETPPGHAWPEGERDPLGRHWRFEVGIDVAGKTGNAERFSAGGRASATLQGPDDRLVLSVRSAVARDDGVESDNHIVGGVDFESYFLDRHSWYARVELEYDRVRKIDLRTTAAAGYGYYFLKKPHHTLRGRTGLMYRHDSLRDEPSQSTVGLDLGISHMYRFRNEWRLINDITYTPSVETRRDYRIYHESFFEIPLVASHLWKLQLGVTNDYVRPPARQSEDLDTTYFGRLVFSWN